MHELPLGRQRFLLICFTFIVSLAILAPLGSNQYMPDLINIDFRNHVSIIVMAKEAMDEGQIPIRVSRTEHNSLRYPLFQFYSPFYYTIAGGIYKWITPQNPYIALKIMLTLGLMLGGLFAYRCAYKITQRGDISLLSSAFYMCSPYTLITIHFRSACPENFALGLIPGIIYYTLLLFEKQDRSKNTLVLALLWSILLLTHTITFFYTAVFLSLLALIYCCQTKQYHVLLSLVRAYLVTLVLCFWYIAPMLIIKPFLFINELIYNPFVYKALTPLSALLSFSALSPTPLPGPIFHPPSGDLSLFAVYASIGLPALFSVAGAVYYLFSNIPDFLRTKIASLILVFLIVLIFLWIPFDIYSWLPGIFQMAQFPYRLLSQTQWLSYLIFILVLQQAYCKALSHSTVILLLALILLSCASWIPTQENSQNTIEKMVKQPTMGYGNIAYLLTLESVVTYMPESIEDGEIGKNCGIQKGMITCTITPKTGVNSVRLPILYYPHLLKITLDGETTEYYPTFGWEGKKVVLLAVPDGTHIITAKFTGYRDANIISLLTFCAVIFALTLIYAKKQGLRINLTQFHRWVK